MTTQTDMLTDSFTSADGPYASLALTGNLNIQCSDKVLQDLKNLVFQNDRIHIELNELMSIDTSILQLLLATTQTANNNGCKLKLTGFQTSPLPSLMEKLGFDKSDFEKSEFDVIDRSPSYQATPSSKLEKTPSQNDKNADELFWLTENQMNIIRIFIPKMAGRKRTDDLRILSGIIHVKKCGLSWRETPPAYGSHKTLYSRWRRWQDSAVFIKIINGLETDFPHEITLINVFKKLLSK